MTFTFFIPMWVLYSAAFIVGFPLAVFLLTMLWIGISQWKNNRSAVNNAQPLDEIIERCPKCLGVNDYNVTNELEDGTILEAKTRCKNCGHENYWEYGLYKYEF